jgi:HlyD family secretion protein
MTTGRFRTTILLSVLFLMLLGVAAAWKYLSGRTSADRLVLSGTIEADEIHIGSKVSGRIEAVLVKEGQEVKQGEPIIRFDRYDLDARHADAVAAVAQAEANLQKTLRLSRPEEIAAARAQEQAARKNYEIALNGPRKEEIDAAGADVRAADADYQVAKATLERIAKLVRDGVQSQQEYDNAKAAYERAAAQHEAARQKLNLLLAGTRPEEIARERQLLEQATANRELVERGARKEDIESAKAQVERARAALQQIDKQVGELEVKAPADAFVEVLQLRPGDLIMPDSPVATLVEVDRLWVRVYVPEPELGHVQLQKDVSVTVDTFSGEQFNGRIEEIASRGEFTPRNVQTRDERSNQVFAVRVRIDNDARKLRAGMAADVTIPK